jgi:hypothetical protein
MYKNIMILMSYIKFNKILKFLIMTVGVIICIGCAGNKPMTYVTPIDGPTAKLRFISKVSLGRQIWFYENEKCKLGKFGGSIGFVGGFDSSGEVSELHMLDTPPRSNQVIERLIPAERPAVFSFIQISGVNPTGVNSVGLLGNIINHCTVTMIFTPKANAQYEAVYSNSEEICNVAVYELIANPDNTVSRVPESTARESTEKCGVRL